MSPRDAFDGIVASLNDAMLADAAWARTSALIDEAVGAKGSILTFGGDTPEPDIEIYFSKCFYRGMDRSDWQSEYFRDHHKSDEHLPRLRQLPDSKVVHITELFNETELKTSSTYNEALPHFDCQNGLNVRLDGPGGSRIVWGIADPVDASGWSPSQLGVVARLLPHLRQYVCVRSVLADAGVLGRSMSELLDNTRMGVVQLDRGGKILDANDTARELFRRKGDLSDRFGALRTASPETNERLQELLVRAIPRFGRPGISGSMLVRDSTRRPRLAVHVKPVVNREVDVVSRRVAALVLIVDPTDRVRIDPILLQEALGLTPAEAEIAVLLAQGRTVRQIAAATGRGYSTVRTHLKHMFAKLGVSRQLEVAQLVLALASLPPPRA